MQEEKNVVLVAHYGAEVCMIFVAFISIGLLYEPHWMWGDRTATLSCIS